MSPAEKIDSDAFSIARKRNPHLKDYIAKFEKKTKVKVGFEGYITKDMVRGKPIVNIIYPVGDPVFIHITNVERDRIYYIGIEPILNATEMSKKDKILNNILDMAPTRKMTVDAEGDEENMEKLLETLLKESIAFTKRQGFFSRLKGGGVYVTKKEYDNIRYHIFRDLLEHGPLEPLIRDPFIEDIHAIGITNVNIVHKVLGMTPTNVAFQSLPELDKFLRNMSERIGRPVSDSSPVVDGALPDGSRINIIYSEDVSKGGASFTIRKFSERPPTMIQLIKWGTFSAAMAAYVWLCLEHKMSLFMSGETASGKTTSLNAMLNFINYNSKIFTAEDTPEVIVPHPVWQRLITRESGPEASRVTLFDLIKAALRSRPDYIIVGEIRGVEGAVAFQAIQTGHAVLSTFHASSIQKMIQRFTGDPIRVPIRFMDNLNIACFQELIYRGGMIVRRCSSIEEIIGFSSVKGGVLNRAVFQWDPVSDVHSFRGMYNSHILENKVAPIMGLPNIRDIYDEMMKRKKFIQNLVDDNLVGYDEVRTTFKTFYERGWDALPSKYLS
ncbi:MAG: type II/IV secretion system ATPase subunit [Candidatus Thermoplasmatota archaeon]|jgi:flagellar protein FlaI|nr:type II/IV secretion system ATPase subunit [Candidatus Thermoplasmatota archaeon]MDP7266357.1 type II/IV secretion system ATPase subunit [Candidatus Thermoplasmatota archaeon]